MSYQVLARKWRPRVFSDMVGQEHVLQALVNALQQNRLHHAYLFTGTRGVGKTTVARVLAKALNCKKGVTPEPCGDCQNCLDIDEGRFVDLIEVDAASKTKVEDTRELLDNVQYTPTQGQFKIYLIDEVHMLSNHSFNALLKTLEEPPAHVKFLLATTDPQKLPATILSRCLQFHLKNLLPAQIEQYLSWILQQESIPFEQEALAYIAQAAQGSMRDALSILDQAIAHSNSNICAEQTRSMLGYTKQQHIHAIINALADNDGKKLLEISQNLATEGADYHKTLESLLDKLYTLSLQLVLPETKDLAKPEPYPLAQKFNPQWLQLLYQIALKSHQDLSISPNLKTGFEMSLLRMLAFQPAPATHTSQRPSSATTTPFKEVSEKRVVDNKQTSPQQTVYQNPPNEPTATPTPRRDEQASMEVKKQQLDPVEEQPQAQKPEQSCTPPATTDAWEEIVNQLHLSGLTLSLAQHCQLLSQDNGILKLGIAAGHQSLMTESIMERLQTSLQNHMSRPIKLEFSVIDTNLIDTPASKQEKIDHQKQQEAEKEILDNPQVSQFLEQFDANIVDGSIKPLDE